MPTYNGQDMSASSTSTFLDYQEDIYQSYTGSDIRAIYTSYGTNGATPSQKIIGTLSSLTVSIVREVTPKYRMGSSHLTGVARGKRAITGTMSFTIFDRDPLLRDLVADNELETLSTQYRDFLRKINNSQAEYSQYFSGGRDSSDRTATDASTFSSDLLKAISNLRTLVGKQRISYADQLAPFDIAITFVNDQGAASFASLRQIWLVTTGVGLSSHDTEMEQVHSYIARYYDPLTSASDKLAPKIG